MDVADPTRQAPDIASLLAAHERKDVLRLLLCGSVDCGKSTLIGRLLYETGSLYADQLTALRADSRRLAPAEQGVDFALVTDGLSAEREQGITIDVAYRHFSTTHRHFIVADAPGHEQYTRNMVTGASTADAAVIVVDGLTGITTQTRRHSYLVWLLGIQQVLVAINKMDLLDHDQSRFQELASEYIELAELIGLEHVTCIPVCASSGDNLSERGRLSWFEGPTLLGYLESVDARRSLTAAAFRMPVQWVNRA